MVNATIAFHSAHGKVELPQRWRWQVAEGRGEPSGCEALPLTSSLITMKSRGPALRAALTWGFRGAACMNLLAFTPLRLRKFKVNEPWR